MDVHLSMVAEKATVHNKLIKTAVGIKHCMVDHVKPTLYLTMSGVVWGMHTPCCKRTKVM